MKYELLLIAWTVSVLIQKLHRVYKKQFVLNGFAVSVYLIAKYYLLLPQLYWSDNIMPYKSLLLE